MRATATANSNAPRKSRVVQALVVIAAVVIIGFAGWFTFNMWPKFSAPVVANPPAIVVAPQTPKVTTPWAPWNNLPNLVNSQPSVACDPTKDTCCGYGLTATPIIDGIPCTGDVDYTSQDYVHKEGQPLTDEQEQELQQIVNNFNQQ